MPINEANADCPIGCQVAMPVVHTMVAWVMVPASIEFLDLFFVHRTDLLIIYCVIPHKPLLGLPLNKDGFNLTLIIRIFFIK